MTTRITDLEGRLDAALKRADKPKAFRSQRLKLLPGKARVGHIDVKQALAGGGFLVAWDACPPGFDGTWDGWIMDQREMTAARILEWTGVDLSKWSKP